MPDEDTLYDLSEFLKMFGDLTRVKIICALLDTAICVHDLAALLDMRQSAVSHQLRVLKHSGLVRFRREGKHAFYFLDDEHIRKIIGQALAHIAEKRAGRPAKESDT